MLLFERLKEESNNIFIDVDFLNNSDNETNQTKDSFSEKWGEYNQEIGDSEDAWKKKQFVWFLSFNGFKNKNNISNYIKNINSNTSIIDAGCGTGYKTYCLINLCEKGNIYEAGFQIEYFHEEEACLSGRFTKI